MKNVQLARHKEHEPFFNVYVLRLDVRNMRQIVCTHFDVDVDFIPCKSFVYVIQCIYKYSISLRINFFLIFSHQHFFLHFSLIFLFWVLFSLFCFCFCFCSGVSLLKKFLSYLNHASFLTRINLCVDHWVRYKAMHAILMRCCRYTVCLVLCVCM